MIEKLRVEESSGLANAYAEHCLQMVDNAFGRLEIPTSEPILSSVADGDFNSKISVMMRMQFIKEVIVNGFEILNTPPA